MTTRAKNIAYWTTTILIAFFIGSGGGAQIAQYYVNPHGVVPVLGYPMYFFAILGFWKVLGAIAIPCRVFRGSRNGRMPASFLT
jgi:hypothetical protein